MRTLALMLLLAAAPASAAKAPDFKIAQVLGGPVKSTSLRELKGKVVFIEFWATWCAPCVAGIPRSNRLVEKLKGTDFVFLAVTDEPVATIEKYLKKQEMKAWVGIDEARSSLKAFKIHGRPDGYLIGKDGTLLARIFPDSLQEEDVRAALAGTFKPRAIERDDADFKTKGAADAKPLFEVRVASGTGTKGMMRMGADMLEATHMDFAFSVAKIWDTTQTRVLVEAPVPKYLDFRAAAEPKAFPQARLLLRAAIEAAFSVSVAPETRMTEVLVLEKAAAGTLPAVVAADGDGPVKMGAMACGWGRLLGSISVSEAARCLESELNKPVVDESKLTGPRAFDLEWKGNDRAAMDAALASIGLKLTPDKRKVDFLRVISRKD